MTAPVLPLLSTRQRRIIAVIRDFAVEYGYAPTVREIAESSGLTPSACWYQINQLARKGWIRRHPRRPRALVVLDPDDGTES